MNLSGSDYFKLESDRVYEGRLDERVFGEVHDKVFNELKALLETLENDGLGRSKLVHMRFSGNKGSKKPRIV